MEGNFTKDVFFYYRMDKNKPKTTKRKKRRVLGSRSYKNYSEEMLELAVDMIEMKRMTSREAEKRFGIPRRTILNKVKKVHIVIKK